MVRLEPRLRPDFVPTPAMVDVARKVHAYGIASAPGSFWKARFQRNIEGKGLRTTQPWAWRGLLVGLLTSQARSVASSEPGRRPWENPALSWEQIEGDPGTAIVAVPGMRFPNEGPKRLVDAAYWLKKNWDFLKELQANILAIPVANAVERYAAERKAADVIMESAPVGVKGLGPKQARNFWQFLGTSAWTCVLDQRVARILNAGPFNLGIRTTRSGGVTASPGQYVEHELAVFEICRAAETYPCMLDAAFFDMEEFAHAIVGVPRRIQPFP